MMMMMIALLYKAIMGVGAKGKEGLEIDLAL